MKKLDQHPLILQTGVPTRLTQRVSPGPESAILLKASHVSPEGIVTNVDQSDYVDLESVGDMRHLVTSRDLLFQARGSEFRPCLPPLDADTQAYVASTVFIVLKIDEEAPDGYNRYLFGALQSPGVQAQLQRASRSTTIPTLSVREMRNVEIPIPDANFVRRYAALVLQFHTNVTLRDSITNVERMVLSAQLPAA